MNLPPPIQIFRAQSMPEGFPSRFACIDGVVCRCNLLTLFLDRVDAPSVGCRDLFEP